MDKVQRFGVSLEPGLLKSFDALINEKGYSNRSEAIRDLIRGALVERQWDRGRGWGRHYLGRLHWHRCVYRRLRSGRGRCARLQQCHRHGG